VSLCVDLETDWGGRLRPGQGTCRGIERGLPLILADLAERDLRATFFVSGELAARHADTLRELARAGHEVASHGMVHHEAYDSLTPDELRRDVVESKHTLEDLLAERVLGFRSPRFRVSPALPAILHEAGFTYDSSCCPSPFWRGVAMAAAPFRWGPVIELPVTAFAPLRLPLGLLWINAVTYPVFAGLVRTWALPRHVVMYCHPFDLLPRKHPAPVALAARAWYRWRSEHAADTLVQTLRLWRRQGRATVTMAELAQIEAPSQ